MGRRAPLGGGRPRRLAGGAPRPMAARRFGAVLLLVAALGSCVVRRVAGEGACLPGSAPKGAACAVCDERSASPRGLECTACGPGTQADAANTACETCGVGKVGMGGLCDFCVAGKQPSPDHQLCTDCPLGRWAVPGGKCKAYVSFKESKITAVGAGKSAYFWCDSSQLVRWIYDEIDDDKDAQISRAELRTSPFDATLRANWDLIDTSGDHFATWEEWSTYFNGLKTTIGDKWRAYILRTGCKGAGGESSCVPPMQAQPSPTYGACTACSNAVTDDGRQCKELPAMHCSSLANGTVACTVEHGVATDTTYLAAFGSAFEDPDCAWGGSTAWIGQAEMSGQLCSFAKAPAEAGYTVHVGVRASSVADGSIESQVLYNLKLVPSAGGGGGTVAVSVAGPTTVPTSPLSLSVHRSCADELVSPTAAEEYISTTYPACLKATLCCGYTFQSVRSFNQAPNLTSAASFNGSGVVSYALQQPGAAEAISGLSLMGMADVLPGNHAAGPPRAQIIADPGGIEAYLDFKPRAVTDEAGSGFFHVSSVVVTPLGETKVLGSTLPVRVKKSKVKDLPSIAAMSSAGSMALIPKIIVAAAIAAAVLTTGGLAYKAYVNRDMKMVAAGLAAAPPARAGHGGAYKSRTKYKTFDVG